VAWTSAGCRVGNAGELVTCGNAFDQVYPIYAITQFSKAYQHQEARQFALDCALGICQAGGPRVSGGGITTRYAARLPMDIQ